MNEQNLIKNSERTPSELREITKKGGIASGESRRKKATMLSVLEKTLDEAPKDSKLTYRELATLGLIKGATEGNAKNYEVIQNLMEQKEKKEEECFNDEVCKNKG